MCGRDADVPAPFGVTLAGRSYGFADLRTLLAKASPRRSGDELAGVAAESQEQRVAAQLCLAEVPLTTLLDEPIVPWEIDDVSRLIREQHDPEAFAPVRSMCVGELRDWLLAYDTTTDDLTAVAWGPGASCPSAKLIAWEFRPVRRRPRARGRRVGPPCRVVRGRLPLLAAS